MKYLTRILPYVGPYRHLAVISVTAMLLDVGANLLQPWPLKILVDNVLGRHPLPAMLALPLGPIAHDRTHLLIFAVVGGLAVTFLANGLSILTNYVNTKLEQQVILDFRSDLFNHAQRLGVSYHDQRNYGRMMYSVNFEADAAGGLIMSLQPIAQSVLTLIGMFWISFQIDHELALLSLIVLPFLYYSVGYYAGYIQPRLSHVKNMEFMTLSVIHDAMSMIRVVIAFCREAHEHRRYRTQGASAVDARVAITVRQTAFTLAVNMTTAVGTALVLGFGAFHALRGELTVGQLLVVMSYIGSVYQPLEAISYTIGALQDRFVALGMAFKVLDTAPEVHEAPDAVELQQARGSVTFENVSFHYPNRAETLAGISFHAQAGQVVALVGPTGAGKTTLISLIPRLYDPQEGRVCVDGVDVRALTLGSLREQVSLVPQEPVLFSGTIADNIQYGRLEATREEIIQAAVDANAHDFIMRLPDGYETEVGERGVQLSGGERQRICVARAFLKNAPILILDEPTSAIDSKTESVILDALDRLMVGRTTFMIAHRLSTIRYSDLILVLNEGQLIEQGTHEELLRCDGLYKQLYDVQLGQRRVLGSEPVALSAAYRPDLPLEWRAGGMVRYDITVTNTGAEPWTAGGADPVKLSVHFGGESDVPHDGWVSDLRFDLPDDVPPGVSRTLHLEVTAPESPGTYMLRHRLVKENIAWFDQLDKSEVQVEGPWPETTGSSWLEPGLAKETVAPAGRGSRYTTMDARWRMLVGVANVLMVAARGALSSRTPGSKVDSREAQQS